MASLHSRHPLPAAAEEEEERLSSSLQRHNVRVLGQGPETVVLAHGFGTNQSIWQFVLPFFDLKKYRLVLFDHMGGGSTNTEQFDYERYSTLHGFADDLLDILFELGIERCSYVGHSMSGMIGLLASIEAPNLFQQIIALGASPRYINEPGYLGGFNVEDLDEAFARMQANYRAWATGFGEMLVGEENSSAKVREYCRTLYLMRPDIAFHITRTIFRSDMRHILPQVTVPVHLVQTVFDAAVPLKVAEHMCEHMSSVACLDLLPVSGHIPHLTAPEVVGPAILRHVRRRCSKRGLKLAETDLWQSTHV